VNAEIDKVEQLDRKGDQLEEEVAPEKERKTLVERRKKAEKSSPVTKDERENLEKKAQRVQYVPSLEYGQLWERAHDPKLGLIVRVNESHPFVIDIISAQSDNVELIKALDILFYSLARGEYELVYQADLDQKLVEENVKEVKIKVGTHLSETMRRIKK
jgi:hypothetical protein